MITVCAWMPPDTHTHIKNYIKTNWCYISVCVCVCVYQLAIHAHTVIIHFFFSFSIMWFLLSIWDPIIITSIKQVNWYSGNLLVWKAPRELAIDIYYAQWICCCCFLIWLSAYLHFKDNRNHKTTFSLKY